MHFFFQAEDGIRDSPVTGVQTCALPIYLYMPVKNSHVVLKYSLEGKLLMTLGAWDQPSDTGWSGETTEIVGQAAGPFHRPTDVGQSNSGDLYISDGYGNARIHKFSNDGKLLFSWGSPGKAAPGAFHVPHGVWVHKDGRVIVADRENDRIQVFNSEGDRSEERRVGKECRSRWSPDH